MDISIIIPTYKPQEYIWECLESIYNQTLSKEKFEVILVLNGCDEPWRSQIQSWIDNHLDINVNFIQTNTPGVSNARNIGLNNAKGDYITFIDDDDFISINYLDSLYQIALNNKKDSVICSNVLKFDEKNGIQDFHEDYLGKALLKLINNKNFNSIFKNKVFLNQVCCKLFNRELLKNKYFNPTLKNREDTLFMYGLLKELHSFKPTDLNCIYYRRIRPSSAARKKMTLGYLINSKFKEIILYLKLYFRLFPSKFNLLWLGYRIFTLILKNYNNNRIILKL